MHGASLCREKPFSVWVDRFVSNLDRSFMHNQGCVCERGSEGSPALLCETYLAEHLRGDTF